jgi:hypothetical protein
MSHRRSSGETVQTGVRVRGAEHGQRTTENGQRLYTYEFGLVPNTNTASPVSFLTSEA